MFCVFGQVGMLVPAGVVRIVAVVHLDVTHAGFGEASGHQALSAEVIRALLADAVQLLYMLRFSCQI